MEESGLEITSIYKKRKYKFIELLYYDKFVIM